MHPYSYPTAVFTQWEFVPVIHPTELSEKRVGQLHSEAATRGKVDGNLRSPLFLSVTACVRMLRDPHSPALELTQEEWKLWAVWSDVIMKWSLAPLLTVGSNMTMRRTIEKRRTIDLHCAIGELRVYEERVSEV